MGRDRAITQLMHVDCTQLRHWNSSGGSTMLAFFHALLLATIVAADGASHVDLVVGVASHRIVFSS